MLRKVLKQKLRLLILDEINLALHCKLLDMEKVIEILKTVPKHTKVILTRRYAPRELIEISIL